MKPTPITFSHTSAINHAKSYEGEVYGRLDGHANLAMAYLNAMAALERISQCESLDTAKAIAKGLQPK